MSEYLVKLRYYPGDALEKIRERDLKNLAGKYGVQISCEKIENRQMTEGLRGSREEVFRLYSSALQKIPVSPNCVRSAWEQ